MREQSYFVRYGDYFADSLRRSRSSAVPAQTEGHEALSEGVFWTDIWTELKGEHDRYPPLVGFRAGYEFSSWFSGKMGKAILRACNRLQLNWHVVVKVIETCSDRSQAVHRDLTRFLRLGNWGSLAKIVHNDLEDLPMIIHPDRKHDLESIRAGIEQYRDHYFDIHAHEWPRNPIAWEPSANAVELRRTLIKQEIEIERKQEREGKPSLRIENEKKRTASIEVPTWI
jgi:hypothetical protein